jgi:site-specific DNA recombinase
LKVALYTRVSTDEQAKEGYSLEVQREYLEDFAKRQGWEVYYPQEGKIYADDITGYTLDRPALKQLLLDARRKKFDSVLVYKIDRFSRKLKDMLNLIDELEDMGIGFKSATEPFDTMTSAGKLMMQQLGSFAEFERNRIKERVFPGMIKGVERGNWQGARYSPYGYHYNKEKKLLEVVPEEAEIVRLIYSMYIANHSTTQVAGYLYNKGYKTRSGGKFHTKLVGDILKNQVYLGKLVWNRHHYDKKQKTEKGYRYIKNPDSKIIVVQGRHEAIITQEDFDKVQQIRAQNRKCTNKRLNTSVYMLTGILLCAKCGHKYRGSSYITNHRQRKRKPWYRCSAREEHYIKCENPAVRAEVIETQVFAILERIATIKDVVNKRIQGVIKAQIEPDEAYKEQLNDLKTKLKKNFIKQSKLNDTYLEGDIGIEIYKNKSAILREEEQTLKKAIAKLEVRMVEREQSKDYLLFLQKVFNNFDETKKDLTDLQKKNLLRVVFKWIKVDEGRVVDYELYEPFKTLLAKEEGKKIWQLQELQEVAAKRSQSCISRLSAAR